MLEGDELMTEDIKSKHDSENRMKAIRMLFPCVSVLIPYFINIFRIN